MSSPIKIRVTPLAYAVKAFVNGEYNNIDVCADMHSVPRSALRDQI